jgi:hypothetical protein
MPIIKIKRGPRGTSTLPPVTLQDGEPAFYTDTKEVVVGYGGLHYPAYPDKALVQALLARIAELEARPRLYVSGTAPTTPRENDIWVRPPQE